LRKARSEKSLVETTAIVNAETVWEARLHAEVARGGRYLELATTLLQRMRLADAAGGTWEAGDLQSWSPWTGGIRGCSRLH
jgi:hypothetical protein